MGDSSCRCANLSIMVNAAKIWIGYDVRAFMQMHKMINATIKLIGVRLIVKIGWVSSL
jgi:hypothetical protein